MSNSFILLMALNGSKEPLSTTQIAKIISNQSKGKIFKASGVIKDSLENRLRKNGYVSASVGKARKCSNCARNPPGALA